MKDYCLSKKSLKSKTKKLMLYRFKFMKMIYEQYFILLIFDIWNMLNSKAARKTNP